MELFVGREVLRAGLTSLNEGLSVINSLLNCFVEVQSERTAAGFTAAWQFLVSLILS